MSQDKPAKEVFHGVEHPPSTVFGILRRLGPGLIIAGSIVGSGELIGTTTTGAQAGFLLLWAIIIGCIIKIWVQVELGRYTMVSGNTTMEAMNETPGPATTIGGQRVNWLAWYWLVMFLVSLGQLGGIVGGVGQAMQISCPLTTAGREFNQVVDDRTKETLALHRAQSALDRLAPGSTEASVLQQKIAAMVVKIKGLNAQLDGPEGLKGKANDDKIWATLITIVTAILLVLGRYGLVETFSTVLVAGFTAMSVLTVILLQLLPDYAVTWSELISGLEFRVPPDNPITKSSGMATALATFGIIGVGANELIQYPYWVKEKGYGRFTGTRDDSEAWAIRARGWIKVLRWDAWGSAFIYTFATVAFYILGAAILGRLHLVPEGQDMIRTLAVMYEPVFGSWTTVIFLVGAFAVLFSTFFVANAGHARVCANAVGVFGGRKLDAETERGWIRFFSGLFPFVCLACYVIYPNPTGLILASGLMQALMLPMLSFTALYLRYAKMDPRVAPGKIWDFFLIASSIGMLIAGSWGAYTNFGKLQKAVMPPPAVAPVEENAK